MACESWLRSLNASDWEIGDFAHLSLSDIPDVWKETACVRSWLVLLDVVSHATCARSLEWALVVSSLENGTSRLGDRDWHWPCSDLCSYFDTAGA